MASEAPSSGLQFSRKPKKVNNLPTQSSLRSHPDRKDSLSTHINFPDDASTYSKQTSSSKAVKSPSPRLNSHSKAGTASSKEKNMRSRRIDLKGKYSLGSPIKGLHNGQRKSSRSVRRTSSRSSERRQLVGVGKKERKWSHPVDEELVGRLEEGFACEEELLGEVLSEKELGRLRKMHQVESQSLR